MRQKPAVSFCSTRTVKLKKNNSWSFLWRRQSFTLPPDKHFPQITSQICDLFTYLLFLSTSNCNDTDIRLVTFLKPSTTVWIASPVPNRVPASVNSVSAQTAIPDLPGYCFYLLWYHPQLPSAVTLYFLHTGLMAMTNVWPRNQSSRSSEQTPPNPPWPLLCIVTWLAHIPKFHIMLPRKNKYRPLKPVEMAGLYGK